MLNESCLDLMCVLQSMRLRDYVFVKVLCRSSSGLLSLGFGYQEKIIKRFGHLIVEESFIIDDVFNVVVSPPSQEHDR